MALMVWAAKRAVIARLRKATEAGGSLYGIEVAYGFPPEPEDECVYGGRLRASREDALAEHGLVFRETDTIEIRVRVVQAGDDVEAAERRADQIAAAVADEVSAEPKLTGPGGRIAVTGVDTDPTVATPGPEPAVIANCLLTVTVVTTRGE